MVHPEENDQEVIVISRAELIYLMERLDAQRMVGLDMLGDDPSAFYEENRESVIQEGRSSLIQRGFVLPGEGGASDKAEGMLLKCAIASFFPDSTLMVVRNIPQLGEQVLIFFRREDYILLHTFPEEHTHRMEPLDHPDRVLEILLEWFPLYQYPMGESQLQMSLDRFEDFRGLAESRQEDAAVELLQNQALGDDEKLALVQAVENRAISGSFVVLYLEGEVIHDAFSLAVFADGKTAWTLEQPEDDVEDQQISVRRIGPDFVDVMGRLIERWLEETP
ncbi:MAG: hypothetical protein AMJ88_19220, partial [Anaerolineae bacterium SM23_ 63]